MILHGRRLYKLNDETFWKLVDKEKFDKATTELAEETQARCGLILLSTLTYHPEEMRKLNDGPVEEMSSFCHRFEQAVADKITKIGRYNAIEARDAVEKGRRDGEFVQ